MSEQDSINIDSQLELVKPSHTESCDYPSDDGHNDNANDHAHTTAVDSRQNQASNKAIDQSVTQLNDQIENDTEFRWPPAHGVFCDAESTETRHRTEGRDIASADGTEDCAKHAESGLRFSFRARIHEVRGRTKPHL
jgi:hypothetical protein